MGAIKTSPIESCKKQVEKLENSAVDGKTKKMAQDLIDDLRELVECIVCLCTPESAPIYQCVNGHVMCKGCYRNVKYKSEEDTKDTNCPLCRVSIGGSEIRSLIAEKTLEKLPLKCRYEKYGCPIELQKTELENHLISCIYRPIKCILQNCPKKTTMEHFSQHFATHGIVPLILPYRTSAQGSLNVLQESHTLKEILLWHLVCGYEHFYPKIVRRRDGQWHFWVYYYGEYEEAQKFAYGFTISSQDNVSRCFNFLHLLQ